MFEEHPLQFILQSLLLPHSVSLRPVVIHNKVRLFDDIVYIYIYILCDNLPPDVLEHLCNNKLIVTGAKVIPYDIAMGVDVDSMNKHLTLQK